MVRERMKRKYKRDIKEAKSRRDQFLRPMPVLDEYIAMKRQRILELYNES